MDPRLERDYDPKTSDQESFLHRAVKLFRTKERWQGQRPSAVKAHPDLVANGLKPVARSLSLQLVSDPRVAPGTYMLGVPADSRENGVNAQ